MRLNSFQTIAPASMRGDVESYRLSPGLAYGDLIFLSGQIGFEDDGTLPSDPARQAKLAFARVAAVLAEAGGCINDVLAITSYHVGRFWEAEQWFRPVVKSIFSVPYPAWTSVEVAGLAVPGAVLEITTVARRSPDRLQSVQ
jgi:enamine deaminase RidA (YjgF/YER057c/UK114 family)